MNKQKAKVIRKSAEELWASKSSGPFGYKKARDPTGGWEEHLSRNMDYLPFYIHVVLFGR